MLLVYLNWYFINMHTHTQMWISNVNDNIKHYHQDRMVGIYNVV